MAKMILHSLNRLNVVRSTLLLFIPSFPLFFYLLVQPQTMYGAVLWGYTAVVYFLFSFLLYVFLLWIQKSGKTNTRKRLVTFTRIYIRFHVAMALFGFASLSVHIYLMMKFGFLPTAEGLSGLIAIGGLCAVLFTGYLRKSKSSGRRRRFHRYTAYIFIVFVIIHIVN